MIADIFKEMQRQLGGERKAITGLPFGTGATTSYPKTDFATLSKDGYEKNALIYACINELASSASEAKCVVEKQNRKGEWEPWPQSRLQKLLDNPNPLMSAYEFWFHVILYQSLAGNCLWEKEPSKADLTVGLWLMRPDYVSIKAVKVPVGQRARRKIEAYEWRPGTETVLLPVDKVIHFKHPHPRDELWGFPPLAAAAREGDTDNFATDFVGAFFKNAAVPFGILKTKGFVDEATKQEAKERLQQLYGVVSGQARWFEPMILGDDTDWVEMGKSMTDMDFPQLRRITETRICEVFQVPPILIGAFAGLERSTFANYEEARKSFWLETLMPIYKKHADTLNRQLTPEFGKDLRVVWDFSEVKALQEDRTAAWDRAIRAFEASMITRNMALREIGEEDVEGGDIFLVPMMKLAVPIGEKPEPPGAKRLQDVADGRQNVYELKSARIPEEAKERWAKAIDMVAHSWEGIFGKTASALFRKEKEGLLKILRTEGKASTKAAPFETFLQAGTFYLLASKDGWIEEFAPLFAGLIKAQADNILGAYGISFDIDRPEVQEFLEGYTMEFAKGIQGVSEEKLRAIIMQAQSEGWSVPNTRNAIMEMWDGFDKVRAERIARTETIRSSNAGCEEAWKQAGIEYKQWYATIDGRQCPECEAMYEHSKLNPVTVGGNFSNPEGWMGAYPPLHPNCRCTILAYFEE